MTRAPWDITPDMFLSLAEVRRLLAHVRTPPAPAGVSTGEPGPVVDRVIIESLLFSGLRCSEFCALRLADVDLTGGTATFRVRGRGGSGRTVWLPADLAGLLQSYVGDIRPRLLPPRVAPRDPGQPFIVNERGRAYERTGLYRRVVRVLTAAGLSARASVQLLRHTYGYLAYLRTGGNLLFVQRQLGHAHPMVTAVYAALVNENYAELANMTFPGGLRRASRPNPQRRRLQRSGRPPNRKQGARHA